MPTPNPRHPNFPIPGGPELRAKGWRQEALLRLLENVLAVGENPDELIVYAALGKAARNWAAPQGHRRDAARRMDERTRRSSSSPASRSGCSRPTPRRRWSSWPIATSSGSGRRPRCSTSCEKKGLIGWGGLTAGAWQYIGSQGVIQGTYEIFMRIAENRFGGRSGRPLHPDRRARRHGRRAAAGRPHGRRRDPLHRRRSRARAASARRSAISRRSRPISTRRWR